ncbi:Zinc transport protein ZntB-like protein [Drosera capensis]
MKRVFERLGFAVEAELWWISGFLGRNHRVSPPWQRCGVEVGVDGKDGRRADGAGEPRRSSRIIREGFSGHVVDMEQGVPPIEMLPLVKRIPDAVRTKVYKFDENGNYDVKEWDLPVCRGSEFYWYQVQLPEGDESQLFKYLIDVLGRLLKPLDILPLIKSGCFCRHVDDAVIFRVTSADPASSLFTSKLAVRVTGNMVISVSQDRVLGRGFPSFKNPLRLELPISEPPNGQQQGESGGFVIDEHTIQLFMSEADYIVPRSVSNLVIHIIEIYVARQEDDVDKLQTDLDDLENINPGDSERKQLLPERSCAQLLTESQRFLQMIADGEQVLQQVKRRQRLVDADVCNLEDLIWRLRKLKENVKLISKRAKTIQTGLQGWQSNQLNRKLYFISLVSMVFLPLSLLTGVFGMNVGGIPWTSQKGHPEKQGFRNVMLLYANLVIAMLAFYGFLNLRSRLRCGCEQGTYQGSRRPEDRKWPPRDDAAGDGNPPESLADAGEGWPETGSAATLARE